MRSKANLTSKMRRLKIYKDVETVFSISTWQMPMKLLKKRSVLILKYYKKNSRSHQIHLNAK